MRTKVRLGVTLLLSACAASPAPNSAVAPVSPGPGSPPASETSEANAAPAGAAAPAPKPMMEVAIPSDLVDQISRSSEIGRHLFVLDRVAAIGSDVLFKNVQDPASRGVRGYLALPEAGAAGSSRDHFLVSFFTEDTPPRVVYEIRLTRGQQPAFEAFDPPKPADAAFVTLVRARQLAISALTAVPQPLNPLVLPASFNGENGILVYLLAGTVTPNVAVLGKHYRFLFPKDASAISYMLPLSKEIIEIPTRATNGATPEALAVTQVVTDFPLETHVLVSLQIALPIFVATRRGMWRVEGDRISFLGEQVPGSPPAP
jgi:hypothetical protein